MARSSIEWLARPGTIPESFNPITGCSGCVEFPEDHPCWARRMSWRLRGRFGYDQEDPFQPATIHDDKWDRPFHWRIPRTVFVCGMGDLFDPAVSFYWIAQVFSIARQTPKHTYILLTKRPEQVVEYQAWASRTVQERETAQNVWIGASISDQGTADKRLSHLIQAKASIRFLSMEPLLAPVNLSSYLPSGISWCIIGSETGPNHRPMDENWVREVIHQCKQHEIPVFYKQRMEEGKRISLPKLDGKQYTEYPQTTDRPRGK